MKKSKIILVIVISIALVLVFASCDTTPEQGEMPTYEQAYAQAISLGYKGSLEEFISILQGENGESAYEIALRNGFEGTESEWLETLKGKSAYQIAVENGFIGTEAEWLESLQGENGTDAIAGQQGKSAYEIAVDNGFVGTESEWLNSLEGEKGETGANGLSAYQIAVNDGFFGTQSEWLESLIQQNTSEISEIIATHQLTSSVVEVYAEYGESTALASGVVFTDDGYILTNAHCVVYDFGDQINPQIMFDNVKVKFRENETYYQVEIINYDISKDLAIIKLIDAPQNLTPVVFGNSDDLHMGDTAIVIGNAVGLGITAAAGIISETPSLYLVDYMGDEAVEAIRTDAAVNPGNSGGALFNIDGELIGIITFKISNDLYESLGFGLSINFAKNYIDSVIS